MLTQNAVQGCTCLCTYDVYRLQDPQCSINFITGTLDRSASQRGNVVQEMQFSLTSDGRYGALHKNTCFFSLLLLILHWYLMLFDTYPPEFAGHVYCADIYNSLCIHHVADVLLLWCDMLYPQPPAAQCHVLAELLLIWTSSIL